MTKVANVQLLRFIAAVMVVISHISSNITTLSTQAESNIWQEASVLGSYGVDIFFTISGFVITQSFIRHQRTPLEFAILRVFRIFPLYALSTVTFYLSHALFPDLMQNSELDSKHLFSSLTFTSHVIGYQFPYLPQGWTLEIEVYFYLLFGFSIFLLQVFNKNRYGVAKFIVGFLVISILLGAPFIMFEFILGIGLALTINKSKFQKYLYLLLVFVLALLGLFILLVKSQNPEILVGASSTLLLYLAIISPKVKPKLTYFLGDISYSIYLLHGMTIAALLKVFNFLGNSSIPLFFCIIFFLVISISMATFVFFEKPINNFGRNLIT